MKKSKKSSKKEYLSSCCSAPVGVHSGDEGTCCWICSDCKKPCDLLNEWNGPYKKELESRNGVCGKLEEEIKEVLQSADPGKKEIISVFYIDRLIRRIEDLCKSYAREQIERIEIDRNRSGLAIESLAKEFQVPVSVMAIRLLEEAKETIIKNL